MQDSKRVVHITTVHHPYDPRIFHKECQSLQKAGYDVTLIAQGNGNANGSKVDSINHIRLKKYTSRIKRMFLGTFDAYRKAKKLKASIYHFHDPELLLVGWLLKNKSNTVIYDIHEDYVTSILQKDYLKKPIRKFIAAIYKMIENFFMQNMELCLAEKYYLDIYPRGKCILNYPKINETIIQHDRNNEGIEEKLLYTGNVTEDRGALTHASLPSIDQKVSVYFVGKCSSHLADKMMEVVEPNRDKLIIEGIDQFVEKERIEEMYLRHEWLAGIALFPPTDHYMKKELTKFFEYMNAGLPIICSNFPIWKEFIEKYQCGIAVNPYDTDEIREAIHYLRHHPEQARIMGENGKQAVLEELNWHSEEEKLIQWYNQLTESIS